MSDPEGNRFLENKWSVYILVKKVYLKELKKYPESVTIIERSDMNKDEMEQTQCAGVRGEEQDNAKKNTTRDMQPWNSVVHLGGHRLWPLLWLFVLLC